MMPFAEGLQQSQIQRQKVEGGVSGAGGGRKGKSQEFNGDTISIQEDGKVLEMHDGDGCTTV